MRTLSMVRFGVLECSVQECTEAQWRYGMADITSLDVNNDHQPSRRPGRGMECGTRRNRKVDNACKAELVMADGKGAFSPIQRP